MKVQRARDRTASSTVQKLLRAISWHEDVAPRSSPAVVSVAYQGQSIVWIVPGPGRAIDWRVEPLGLVGAIAPRASATGLLPAVQRVIARVDVVLRAAAADADHGAAMLQAVACARRLAITMGTMTADISAAGHDSDVVRTAWASLRSGPHSRTPWPASMK